MKKCLLWFVTAFLLSACTAAPKSQDQLNNNEADLEKLQNDIDDKNLIAIVNDGTSLMAEEIKLGESLGLDNIESSTVQYVENREIYMTLRQSREDGSYNVYLCKYNIDDRSEQILKEFYNVEMVAFVYTEDNLITIQVKQNGQDGLFNYTVNIEDDIETTVVDSGSLYGLTLAGIHSLEMKKINNHVYYAIVDETDEKYSYKFAKVTGSEWMLLDSEEYLKNNDSLGDFHYSQLMTINDQAATVLQDNEKGFVIKLFNDKTEEFKEITIPKEYRPECFLNDNLIYLSKWNANGNHCEGNYLYHVDTKEITDIGLNKASYISLIDTGIVGINNSFSHEVLTMKDDMTFMIQNITFLGEPQSPSSDYYRLGKDNFILDNKSSVWLVRKVSEDEQIAEYAECIKVLLENDKAGVETVINAKISYYTNYHEQVLEPVDLSDAVQVKKKINRIKSTQMYEKYKNEKAVLDIIQDYENLIPKSI